MSSIKWLVVVLVALLGAGCTSSSGKIYRSDNWKPSQSLGRVLVIVPKYLTHTGEERPQRDEKIRQAIRDALGQMPETTVADVISERNDAPLSESRALALAAKHNSQTVCMITMGQFGGRYLLTILPPGWDSRTTVQYSVRIVDVKSGAVLLDSVRERSSGGYLAIKTATYPAEFSADLTSVLSAAP